ncbi:myocardin-related transcription factor A [Indicator indicator]|uniref:myocardin-related transcription factor A n=1 Tax=Indicator indicator TaxID=1002788 RepID=UPI0023DEB4E5|nr:myocardin-related transcription factor A [Indicator indicator]
MLDKAKTLQPAYVGIVPLAETVSKQGKSCSSTYQDSYHSLREVLQLKLQQRRTREELVSQGIMPPLKSPAAFHEQRRSLERARTEDYLKRKIRSRPERSELVRMHILEETSAEPSLQAKQLKLKRARLADDLNEKIAQRPGPMELVEKNILPVESSLKEAIIVGQVNYPKVADNSSFDEDSSDALSPEQPASHESQGSVPSPMDSRICEPLPGTTGTSVAQGTSQLQINADATETLFLPEQPPPPLPPPPLLPHSLTNGVALTAAKAPPTLIKQSQPKSASEKSQRSKKAKELKPKVKKLKYHQYIPPDQKQDKGAPPMDSSYAKILQQQQLFLQLQILNQQQQHYNYQTILPAPPKPPGEQQSGASAPAVRNLSATVSNTSSVSSGSSGLMRQNSNAAVGKPGPLPANLDEMKVAELKQELKLRALPVSGTKTDLIERLRAYQEQNGAASQTAPTPKPSTAAVLPKAAEVVVAFPAARLSTGQALVTTGIAPAEVVVATVTGSSVMKFGSTGSTPPVSPTPSERSQMSTGDENSATGDTFGEMVTSPLTQLTLQASPVQFLVKEESSKSASCSINATPRSEWCSTGNSRDAEVRDKDQMLQEKDKQIEELTRMLKQKQQLVEMLRLQLEQEKRSQQSLSAPPAAADGTAIAPSPAFDTQVKSENGFPSCQSAKQSSGQTDQFSPAPTTSQMDTSNASPVPKKAVMVKQEVPAAEAEPPCQSHSPRLILGQQGSALSDLIKGTPPPTLITDSTGTHIVLTVTKQSAERQGLSPHGKAGSNCPALQRVQSSPSKASSQSPPQLPTSSPPQPTQQQKQQQQPTQQQTLQQTLQQQPRGLNQSVRKPSSQPGSPAAHSPSQMDLERQHHTTLFGSPPPPLPVPSAPMKEPPGYEEAMKQQPKAQENGCSSQQMDDLFDILIQSGEISADFKDQSSPAGKEPPVAPVCSPPPSSHPSSELVPVSLGQPVPVGRLEDFLESSTGLPLLTAGHDGPEPLSLIDDLHSEMLSSSAILDHPPSPMDTSELHFAHEPSGGIALDLAEANLDSMDWLELPGGPVMSLAPLSTAAPSLFSTDFLDGHDLQLHWDSCL